jgi:hypothetical protein
MIMSRRMGWAGLVVCTGEMENAYRIFVGKFLSSYTTGSFSRRAQLHGVSYMDILQNKNQWQQ